MATFVKRMTVSAYCKLNNATELEVFTSAKTGKDYAVTDTGEFVGMISADFDSSQPAFVITVQEGLEKWDFIGNSTQGEIKYTLK